MVNKCGTRCPPVRPVVNRLDPDNHTPHVARSLTRFSGHSVSRVTLIHGNSSTVTRLADPGVGGYAQNGIISGDGQTVAFVTTETLTPDDTDPGLADWYRVWMRRPGEPDDSDHN